jgi:hypothetical protein|tara:strand:- start:228 stop:848 length:621 start_codon:yes stop_codon:yes gene_type:complete
MSNSIATGVAYADPEFQTLSVVGSSTAAAPATITSTSTDTTGNVDASAFVATETIAGAGGVGFSIKAVQNCNVAAGAYLTANYGYLAFGASGRVTGLAAGVTAEIVMSAATTQGTYAALDIEIGMPSGAKTAAATSFMYLSSYGADKATFDTDGNLFTLAGVAKGTGKLLADTTTGSTARPVQVLRVRTPDGIRYIPLYSTVAIAA